MRWGISEAHGPWHPPAGRFARLAPDVAELGKPASQPASHGRGRGVDPRGSLWYIGENSAEKFPDIGDPVKGADGQHISLSVEVLMQNTQVQHQRGQVLNAVLEQAKKALSTGSGSGDQTRCSF